MTIDGVGPTTAARLIAEFGDISAVPNAAAYLGCIPGLRQSGKRPPAALASHRHGNACLRAKL